MMSYYEQDFGDFPSETETDGPNLWLEHIAQSRQINGQQAVGSRRRFHTFS